MQLELRNARVDVEARETLDSIGHKGDTNGIEDGVEGTSVSPEH